MFTLQASLACRHLRHQQQEHISEKTQGIKANLMDAPAANVFSTFYSAVALLFVLTICSTTTKNIPNH